MQTLTKNPMQHSHSRLQVFSQCPLAYKLQYLDKIPTESSDALEIGAAAHEFFQEWVEEAKQERLGTGDYLEKLAAECFQKEPRKQDNFKDYLEICKTFAANYKPDPDYPRSICEQQIAFDRSWKLCGWFDPEVMFRCKIDRIDSPPLKNGEKPKKIRIVDYKTGYAGSMDSFQLDVYALAAASLYPDLEQVEVEFYYVKSGFRQVKLLDVKDLDITKVQLEALMQRIESESKWKPKPGAKCLTCPVAAHCSAKPSELRAISSKTDAETLATEIAFLDAQAKAKKKALNAYCKQEGPVTAGGLVWNHFPRESMVVDIGPFLSACVACQVDPAEVLNPDSTAIKKTMKKNPAFQAAIEPYLGVNVSTSFYAKKADGDDD